MEQFVTINDVIEFAVQREDTAFRLYKLAAQLTNEPSARKMFEEFAVEESTHKSVFSRIAESRSEDASACVLPEPSIAAYMVDVPFRVDMTYREILTYALKAEDGAYNLYRAAAGATDNEELRKILLNFAEVELGHRRRIEAIYEERVLTEG